MKLTVKKVLTILIFCTLYYSATAQLKQVHSFWQDDSLIKKEYYERAARKQQTLLNSLSATYKNDYKEVYTSRFNQVSALLKSSRIVTAAEPHQYLQSILQKITNANPELKNLDVRLVFSRDRWPNAYSIGEGTLVVNAGLMVFLANEAELVFVLCHEIAHYYLEHSDKAIRKNIETINSEEFKAEIKRLSKQEYRAGEQLDKLVKNLAFDSRRHSRDKEAEADKQAFAFMKRTGYDCNAIKTCLQLLNVVDDSLLYKPLKLEQTFHFTDYPFKKRWTQNESVIFGQMNNELSATEKMERDSLKTHPDCTKRIALLEDSIQQHSGKAVFMVNQELFQQLKKEFFAEMAEQEYRDENLTRNLYYNLQMLQHGENEPLAVYSIARGLNAVYESQKNHRLGLKTEKEGRGYPADYNLLLRMFDRLRLDEIASLSYFFCKQYQQKMKGYEAFEDELLKAALNKN